jgi:hypothetical protein
MGKVLDLLSVPVIEERIAGCRAAVEEDAGDQALVESLRAKMMADMAADKDEPPNVGGPPVETALSCAALEHARGASLDVVRKICRDMTERWVPIVEAMDFTPQEHYYQLTQPSTAQRMVDSYGAEVVKEGRILHVRYTTIQQPLSIDIPKVWMCAAICGDRDLARKVAAGYQLRSSDQINSQFAVREGMLRHLLAEDMDQAQALAAKLIDGYPSDFPPERIEFPLGIVNKNVALILEGVKAVTARFKGMWDVKKYEKWHEKNARNRPWKQTLDRTRRDLVGMKWVMSLWAVAFLNIAHWHGMDEVFADKSLFSEWVPIELCA